MSAIFHQRGTEYAGHWPKYGTLGLPYGWAGEYTKYNTIVSGDAAHTQLYKNIVDWINENIQRPRTNAHWIKMGDCIFVQIRKKKDFLLFQLRWA